MSSDSVLENDHILGQKLFFYDVVVGLICIYKLYLPQILKLKMQKLNAAKQMFHLSAYSH